MTSLEFHLWVWKVCGLWHLPGQPRWYLVYSIVFNFVFFFLFPGCIAVQLLWAKNLVEFVEILMILPTLMVGSKSSLIVRNRKKLQRLFDLLEQMDGMLKNNEQKRVIQKAIIGSRILVAGLSFEYYFSIICFFVVSLMNRVQIWSSWYPWDSTYGAPAFYPLLTYQFIGSMLCGFKAASIDVYALALYRLLGAHLDVLGIQLSQLGKDPVDEGNLSLTKRQLLRERELFKCLDYHKLCSNKVQLFLFLCNVRMSDTDD